MRVLEVAAGILVLFLLGGAGLLALIYLGTRPISPSIGSNIEWGKLATKRKDHLVIGTKHRT